MDPMSPWFKFFAGLLAAAAPTTGGLFVCRYLRRRADVPDPVLGV